MNEVFSLMRKDILSFAKGKTLPQFCILHSAFCILHSAFAVYRAKLDKLQFIGLRIVQTMRIYRLLFLGIYTKRRDFHPSFDAVVGFRRRLSAQEMEEQSDDRRQTRAHHKNAENDSHNAGKELLLIGVHNVYLLYLLRINFDLLDFNILFLQQGACCGNLELAVGFDILIVVSEI